MIRLNCDYLEGCHPAILEALAKTNLEQNPGYGLDDHCTHAAQMIKETFSCPDSAVHFLVGGTQVNTTMIASVLRPYEGVLCADTGHINVHETGAIEATGHKVLALPNHNGKITAAQIEQAVAAQEDSEHAVRPGMVYISLSTETGTMYTLAELKSMYASCKRLALPLYIDGARLGYALMSPGCDITPADLPACCDAFTIGGTKVGALFGEALVINDHSLNTRFRYMIKQRGGLLAKGRLLGIQFEVLMQDNLYFSIGKKAADQACRVHQALEAKGIPMLNDSLTNQQFPIFTLEQAEKLGQDFVMEDSGHPDAEHVCMRICTSWATTDEMVQKLIDAIEQL